ncbi:MAG TPA: hypothetical protein DD376_03400 [Sutterella sp.]|nr:hypothetical protein [Sutterella sp.]
MFRGSDAFLSLVRRRESEETIVAALLRFARFCPRTVGGAVSPVCSLEVRSTCLLAAQESCRFEKVIFY